MNTTTVATRARALTWEQVQLLPTLERRVHFLRDHGVEAYAVGPEKIEVTAQFFNGPDEVEVIHMSAVAAFLGY